MFVYRPAGTPDDYDVGYFDPAGSFVIVKRVRPEGKAFEAVHYLNGGNAREDMQTIAEWVMNAAAMLTGIRSEMSELIVQNAKS